MDQKEISVSSKKFRNKSIIAFLVFIVVFVAAVFAWKWLRHQPQVAGAQKTLRKALAVDEKVFSKTLSKKHLAKTYPVSAAAGAGYLVSDYLQQILPGQRHGHGQ